MIFKDLQILTTTLFLMNAPSRHPERATACHPEDDLNFRILCGVATRRAQRTRFSCRNLNFPVATWPMVVIFAFGCRKCS